MESRLRKRQDMEIGGLEEPDGQRIAETGEQGACPPPTLYPSGSLRPWLTKAAGAIQAAGKTTGTGAHVAPSRVGAVAPRAEAGQAETLVYVCVDRHGSEPSPQQP